MIGIENGIHYKLSRTLQRVDQEVSVLGERIKELREKHNYTQKSFAEALGKWLRGHKQPGDDKKYTITRQQVHEWEMGKKVPNAFYLRGMGEILETPTDFLTGATNDPNSRIEEQPLSGPEKELVRAVRKAPRPVQEITYRMFNVEPPPPTLPANVDDNDHLD